MRILIIGKTSFIGQGIGAWFARKQPAPAVSYLSVRDEDWKEQDFSAYDAVIFTAALVHRPDITDWEAYQQINATLPWEFAKHVKTQGVKQFVFFSSVSVYQAERSLPAGCIISEHTPLEPDTMYGKSKLLAEQRLQALADRDFHVSIIRPTFVYGKGCRGRHIDVQKMLATKLPVLPKAFEDVKMGMVYIDNLAELTWLAVNSGRSGVYHAQDKGPMSTYEVLKTMSEATGKKKRSLACTWLFRPFTRLSLVTRLFGGSAYSEETARCPLGEYRVVSAKEGILRTVR